ncbi:uncharacterized protein N7515_009965 [Penicillium bovifimosum]|uniref:Transposase Tc1-like domain-containing protein n=1 Tax=Penicillium bovifimosum TaxID=126998 RepID=A0A9W9KUM9_9EURO|nr:uncharacterized protein N7515_009965 [Penicillium bovifimosum]KAJ5120577.1 hypothetical protein N7515_009965 [Penicillium bovifimosum]
MTSSDIALRTHVVALKVHTNKSSEEIATVCDKHVQDKPRSGRPRKGDLDKVIAIKSQRDPNGREKSYAAIASELRLQGVEISTSTISRILKSAGYTMQQNEADQDASTDEEDES